MMAAENTDAGHRDEGSLEFVESEIARIEAWLAKLRSDNPRNTGVQCLYEGQLAKLKGLRAEMSEGDA